ncbi:hypothetical protein [Nitrososphaera sp.]|uniref:hypothetical protein n=1 Tax=Nitrososphaera sp. TaxID=1971748 RepID=UPI002EDA6E97
MNKTRTVAAKTFMSRMNEGRGAWLTEEQMIKACEEFFKENGYSGLDRDVVFAGHTNFTSPLVASSELQTIATAVRPKIEKYDIGFLGSLESILYDIIDNQDKATLVLATDSLSYSPILQTEEISVEIENLMDEGMFLLFLNGRGSHALFDEFEKLSMPVQVSD